MMDRMSNMSIYLAYTYIGSVTIGGLVAQSEKLTYATLGFIWRFPKLGVPPNHPFVNG